MTPTKAAIRAANAIADDSFWMEWSKRDIEKAAKIIDQEVLKLLRALEYIASCKSPGCCRVCGERAKAAIADAEKEQYGKRI